MGDTFFSLYRANLEANLEERERVEAAKAKPPEERTEAEEAAIAYSPYGTAAGCSCGVNNRA